MFGLSRGNAPPSLGVSAMSLPASFASDNGAEQFARNVMHAVVRSGIIERGDDAMISRAIEVMRAECKAALFAPEYADARECVIARTMHETWFTGLVVAECIAKLKSPA